VLFPTLVQIALDVLPCQVSSVPCECLFSASKQTANLRRSSLGAERFKELQVMKFAWCKDLPDFAAQNWAHIEDMQLEEYVEILGADEISVEWEHQLQDGDEFILEYAD
jgi:hypothetical protein